LQLLADVSVGVGAHMFSPEMGAATLLSTMASQSPKLALYGSYAAGRAARAASDVKQAAKTKLSEITSRK
jgi:hypothetical protein